MRFHLYMSAHTYIYVCNGSLFGLPLSLLMGFVCALFISSFLFAVRLFAFARNNHLEQNVYVCRFGTDCLCFKSMQICVPSICSMCFCCDFILHSLYLDPFVLSHAAVYLLSSQKVCVYV